MDIKKFIEEQIEEIVKFKEQHSKSLSTEEFVSLHRQLESYLHLLRE